MNLHAIANKLQGGENMFSNVIIYGKENRYKIVDFLKGFSIITIVFMHLIQNYITETPSFIKTASSIGGSGVHLFFLLSGFGLYYSYLKKKISFLEFIKRKFFKLYIPYIIVIFISALFPFMYNQTDKIIAVVSHVLLFKMFSTRFEDSFGAQFWYMSTIFQLYFVFIPLCRLKGKLTPPSFLRLALIISVMWWVIVAFLGFENERIWCSFFLQYLWEFAIGMVIAEFLFNGGTIIIRVKYLVPISILSLLVTTYAYYEGGYLRLFNDITSLVGYGGIALIIYSIKKFKYINFFVGEIANISYELYLIHMLVFSCLFKLLSPHRITFQVIVGIMALGLNLILAYGYKRLMYRFLQRIS